jgi:hypothetical protein
MSKAQPFEKLRRPSFEKQAGRPFGVEEDFHFPFAEEHETAEFIKTWHGKLKLKELFLIGLLPRGHGLRASVGHAVGRAPRHDGVVVFRLFI